MEPVTRQLVEFIESGEVAASPGCPIGGERVSTRLLSGDAGGAGWSAAVTADAGGAVGGRPAEHDTEIVVVEGTFEVGDRTVGPSSYLACRKGEPVPALTTVEGGTLFVEVGRPGVVPACIGADDGEFVVPDVPDCPVGLEYKLLSGDPNLGPSAWLLRVPPDWSELRTEWHECAEEMFVLEGDLWHDRANGGAGGTMTKGSYFWRPPYVWHSPMGSTNGMLGYFTVDGQLKSHYVEDGELQAAADAS